MATSDNTTTPTTDAPLKWAPPSMSNPTIIDLSKTGNQTWWQFADNQDVIFIGSDTVNTNQKIQTQGGHNIMLLGGEYQSTGDATGTLAFYGVTGEVWVDGVVVDNKNTHNGQDGIDISGANGAQPNLVVQNSKITNINGAQSAGHADVAQTQGSAGDLKFYNVSGDTNYQGLFLAPQYTPETKSLTLENVNLSYNAQAANDGSKISYLLWTLDGPNQTPYPANFNNVYVQPRDGQQAIETAVWPKAAGGAVQNGDQISWPDLPYKGSVTVGTHADFADASKIGLNFHDGQAILDAVTNGKSVATAPTDSGTASGSASGTSAGGTTATSPAAPAASDPAAHTGASPTTSDPAVSSSTPTTAAPDASMSTTPAAGSHTTGSAIATDAPLKWAPPEMHDPVIVDLAKTGGQTWWNFANNQDVIVINSAHTTLDLAKIQFQGGHNIEVLGIDMKTAPGQTGAIQFNGITGTAFVDGVHIDNANASGTDGIDIAGGNNGDGVSLIVQNTIIENVNGAYSGGQASNSNGHADGIQMQGPVGGELNLHNVHISTNYEGLFLAPQYNNEPKQANFSNVDLHYTTQAANDGSQTTYLLWTLDGGNEKPYPINFDNVYVQPRNGQQAIESAVWPKAAGGAVQNGDHISWPDLPYKGSVTVGDHASFADASKVGLNFQDTQAIIDASTNGTPVATDTGSASGSASGSAAGGTTTDTSAPATSDPAASTSAPSTSAPSVSADTGHADASAAPAPVETAPATPAPTAPADSAHTDASAVAAPTVAVEPVTADNGGSTAPAAPAPGETAPVAPLPAGPADTAHTDASAVTAPTVTVEPIATDNGGSTASATPAPVETAPAAPVPAAPAAPSVSSDSGHAQHGPAEAPAAPAVGTAASDGAHALHDGMIDISGLLNQIRAEVQTMGSNMASEMKHLANLDHIAAQIDAAVHPAVQAADVAVAHAAQAVDAHHVHHTQDHWHTAA